MKYISHTCHKTLKKEKSKFHVHVDMEELWQIKYPNLSAFKFWVERFRKICQKISLPKNDVQGKYSKMCVTENHWYRGKNITLI